MSVPGWIDKAFDALYNEIESQTINKEAVSGTCCKESSAMKQKLYNTAVVIFCLASIALAVVDLRRGLTPAELWTDRIIYGLFVADYLVRLILAEDKRAFVKGNIFDLIAIIPFNSLLRAFRLARFARLLRLLRLAAVLARALSKFRGILNTNGFKYILSLSGLAVLASAIAMVYVEGMQFSDALWWAFVTATTVGYGDLSPATTTGRIIAAILMVVGIGLIGSLTSSITSFFLNRQEAAPYSSERVEMVAAMYDRLTEEEKAAFLATVDQTKTPPGPDGESRKENHHD